MSCAILAQNINYKNSEAFLIFRYNGLRIVIPMTYKIEDNYLVNMDVY